MTTRIKAELDQALGIEDPGSEVAGVRRSGKWPAVAGAHLEHEPGCAICGVRKEVNVHHVLPYHLYPDHELRPDNLITLCRAHHLCFGHLGRWSCFNPLVRADAEIWRFRLRVAKALMRMAKEQHGGGQSRSARKEES